MIKFSQKRLDFISTLKEQRSNLVLNTIKYMFDNKKN